MFQIRITVNNCEKLRTKIPLSEVTVNERHRQSFSPCKSKKNISRFAEEERKLEKSENLASHHPLIHLWMQSVSIEGSLIWWKFSSFWVRVGIGVQSLNTTLFTILVNGEFSNDPWLTPDFMNGSFHKQILQQVDRVDPPQYDCISIA